MSPLCIAATHNRATVVSAILKRSPKRETIEKAIGCCRRPFGSEELAADGSWLDTERLLRQQLVSLT